MDSAQCSPTERWCAYLATYLAEAGVPRDRTSTAAAALPNAAALTWTRECPGASAGLTRMAAAATPLAIVSNSDGSVARRLRERGLCKVGRGAGTSVLTIVDSGVVGIEKPDPRIFELALEVVDVDPSAPTNVGGSLLIDVIGAQRAGLLPLHMDPYDMCPTATINMSARSRT